MSPNPSGANQLGAAPAYGQIKKQTQLAREAPMSGAPLAASATEAPRRASRQARRRSRAAAGPVPTNEDLAAAAATPPVQPDYHAQLASVWQQVAAVPGASQLVNEYAQEAQRRMGGP